MVPASVSFIASINGQENKNKKLSSCNGPSLASFHFLSFGFNFILRIWTIIQNENHYFHSLSQKKFPKKFVSKQAFCNIKNMLSRF